MVEKRIRSLAKTLSWRLIASTANAIILFIFIGNIGLAVGAGFIDLIIKSLFYYYHERMWNATNWGRNIKKKK